MKRPPRPLPSYAPGRLYLFQIKGGGGRICFWLPSEEHFLGQIFYTALTSKLHFQWKKGGWGVFPRLIEMGRAAASPHPLGPPPGLYYGGVSWELCGFVEDWQQNGNGIIITLVYTLSILLSLVQGARDLDHKSLTLYIFIPEYRRIKVKVCAGAWMYPL